MAKRRSTKSILKAFAACGIEVARFEFKPDGTVVIVPGKTETETEQGNDLDKWLAGKHAH